MPQPTIQVTVRLPMPLYDALLTRYGDQTALSGMVLRALESALSKTAPAPNAPLQDSAQTRTPEESNPADEQPQGADPGETSPARRGRHPTRSADSKKGVRPIQRAT